jgi:hypothetical protein
MRIDGRWSDIVAAALKHDKAAQEYIIDVFLMQRTLCKRAIRRRFAELFARAEALLIPLCPMVLERTNRCVIGVGIGEAPGNIPLARWRGGRWVADQEAIEKLAQGSPDSYWAHVSRGLVTLFAEATSP